MGNLKNVCLLHIYFMHNPEIYILHYAEKYEHNRPEVVILQKDLLAKLTIVWHLETWIS